MGLFIFRPILPAAPKIVIPSDSFNFGKIEIGSKNIHEFEIKNEGDEVLKLSKIAAGCACTSAMKSAEIAPGGVMKLPLSIEPTFWMDSGRKTVYIKTNDPKQEFAKVYVDIQIIKHVKLSVSSLHFNAQAGQEMAQSINVESDSAEHRIKGYEYSKEKFEVTEVRTPASNGGETLRMEIKTRKNAPPGAISGNILLEDASGKPKAYEIRLTGYLWPAVRANPETLYFFKNQIGKLRKIELTTKKKSKPILGEVIAPSWLKTEKKGDVLEVTLISAPLQDGNKRTEGTVTIKTLEPEAEIQVLVYFSQES